MGEWQRWGTTPAPTNAVLIMSIAAFLVGAAAAAYAVYCAVAARRLLARAHAAGMLTTRALRAVLVDGFGDDLRFHLWCTERAMWWRPRGMGYCDDVEDAGLYSASEAASIALQASFGGLEHAAVIVVAQPRSDED